MIYPFFGIGFFYLFFYICKTKKIKSVKPCVDYKMNKELLTPKQRIMKSKSNSLLAFSLVAILSAGMFTFASANTQTEQKRNIVVTESKEFQDLNTNAKKEVNSYFIAWTKAASSAIIAWEL